MERSWRQVSALLVLLALLAAACGSDPTEVVVGGDTSDSAEDSGEDTTDETMEDVAMEDVIDVSGSVADDSAPFQTGLVTDQQSETLVSVEAAQAMWERNGIENYDFTWINNNNWVDFEDGPLVPAYEIEVRSGQVERVLPSDDFAFELTDFSIDLLFKEIPEAVMNEGDFVVEFDNTFGIPTLISWTDDDTAMAMRIESFRVAGDYPNECSTARREANIDSSQPENPVDNTRLEIFEALTACDFLSLSYLANVGEQPLLTDFGGSGVETLWEAEAGGEPLMTTLFDLLEGESSTVGGITSWPVEFNDPNSDYLDWRVGISGVGEWLFFIAGD